jgi:glycosyltransferase involved in cell wall biosynthesis
VNAQPENRVFFVVPDAIDYPERVSGGNVYDQRVRDGLLSCGWDVRMIPVPEEGRDPTARALAELPDDALVLIDGLLIAHEPRAIVEHGARLRLAVLAHMVAPDLADREREAIRMARRVIATSRWTRAELIAQDAADPHRIVVAHPGTDPAPPTTASESGGRLLCVGSVTPLKGHDLLVRALADFADLEGWTCTVVGSLRTAPDHVNDLTARIASAGLNDRIEFTGVLTADALEEAYGRADLVVMPSRSESYGMVIAEALARGIPVLATGVGGVAEAIAGSRAGMTVPPDDPWALSVVLREWWTSPAKREDMKAAALDARAAVSSWQTTTAIIASVLAETSHGVGRSTGVASVESTHAGSASRP